LDSPLNVPVIGHFGNDDPLVPEADLQQATDTLPLLEAHGYPAGHTFANHARESYRKEAAIKAHTRNQQFLQDLFV